MEFLQCDSLSIPQYALPHELEGINVILKQVEDNFLLQLLDLIDLNNSDSSINSRTFSSHLIYPHHSLFAHILLFNQFCLVFSIPFLNFSAQLINFLFVLLLYIDMILLQLFQLSF